MVFAASCGSECSFFSPRITTAHTPAGTEEGRKDEAAHSPPRRIKSFPLANGRDAFIVRKYNEHSYVH